MSVQRLSERNTRKIARKTGLDLVYVWGGSGHHKGWYAAVTRDHVHLAVRKDGSWDWTDSGDCHLTSCPGGAHHDPDEWATRAKVDP